MAVLKTNVRSGGVGAKILRQLVQFSWNLSPRITTNWTKPLFLHPQHFPLNEEQNQLLKDGHSFEIALPRSRKKISLQFWGTGPMVFLIHGWAGRGVQMDGLIRGLVDAGYQAVTWDKPGHGDSTGKTGNIFEFLLAAERVSEVIGTPQAIIAHSMGAISALHLAKAEEIPLIFIAPVCQFKESVGLKAEWLGLPKYVIQGIFKRLEEQYGSNIDEVSLHQAALGHQEPVLIFHDEGDRFAPYQGSEEMVKHLPQGKLVRTQNLGHARILQDPDLIEHCLDFLQRETSATSTEGKGRAGARG